MVNVEWGTLSWLAGVPDVSMLFGMVVVQKFQPSKKLESLFQHFGAGVVMCAIAVEILPLLLLPEHENLWGFIGMAIGFVIGVASMILISRIGKQPSEPEEEEEQHENSSSSSSASSLESQATTATTEPHRSEFRIETEGNNTETSNGSGSISLDERTGITRSLLNTNKPETLASSIRKKEYLAAMKKIPWGMVIPVMTDASMDGLLIGIAFVAGSLESGLIMSIALSIEMCFLGIATSAMMKKNKVPLVFAIPICISLPQLILLASFAGATVLASISGPFFVGVLSFGVAALLFLVSDELLVEAHRDEGSDTWWVTSFFFAGFALVIILQELTDIMGPTAASSSI